jgi:hypothetical protein
MRKDFPLRIIMKNKKYYTVGKVPKSNRKIAESVTKSIPLTHKYITTHSLGFAQPLQLKVAG